MADESGPSYPPGFIANLVEKGKVKNLPDPTQSAPVELPAHKIAELVQKGKVKEQEIQPDQLKSSSITPKAS